MYFTRVQDTEPRSSTGNLHNQLYGSSLEFEFRSFGGYFPLKQQEIVVGEIQLMGDEV